MKIPKKKQKEIRVWKHTGFSREVSRINGNRTDSILRGPRSSDGELGGLGSGSGRGGSAAEVDSESSEHDSDPIVG